MSVLDRVEASTRNFRPRNGREFVALHFARKFNDLRRLPRYILAAQHHSKDELIDAAKTARLRHELNRTPISDLFFEILKEREETANV